MLVLCPLSLQSDLPHLTDTPVALCEAALGLVNKPILVRVTSPAARCAAFSYLLGSDDVSLSDFIGLVDIPLRNVVHPHPQTL